MENEVKNSAKTIFIILLICSAVILATAITGMVFTFIYISYLGLYQSLIIGGIMIILVAMTVVTTVWYNKAFRS